MIEIRRNDIETSCAVCGRTLLLGERMVAYERPEGDDARVCELCIDQADALGWIREGALSVPLQLQSAAAARSAACAASWPDRSAAAGVPSRSRPRRCRPIRATRSPPGSSSSTRATTRARCAASPARWAIPG